MTTPHTLRSSFKPEHSGFRFLPFGNVPQLPQSHSATLNEPSDAAKPTQGGPSTKQGQGLTPFETPIDSVVFSNEAKRIQQLLQLPSHETPLLSKTPLSVKAFNPTSLGSGITPSLLAMGSPAYLLQDATLPSSSLQVLLPINPELRESTLMGGILTDGSRETQSFKLHLATQGMDVTATVGDQHIGMMINGPNGKEPEMLQALNQLLLHPNVDASTFNINKKNTLLSMLNLYNATGTSSDELLEQSLFGPEHPHVKSTQQMIRDVEDQQAQQVLAVLQKGLSDPSAIQWVFVSKLPVETQLDLLNTYLPPEAWQPVQKKVLLPSDAPTAEVIQASKSHTHLPPATPIAPPKQPLLVTDNSLERLQMKRIWQAPAIGSPDELTFAVLSQLLRGMNGDLFTELRTKQGLVYSVQSAYSKHPVVGEFRVVADVDIDKWPALEQGMKTAIEHVCHTPPDTEDMERVIRSMVYALRESKRHPEEQSNAMAHRIDAGLTPQTIDERIAKLLTITPEDIQQVAQTYLGSQAWQVTVVSGPEYALKQRFPNQPRVSRSVVKQLDEAKHAPEVSIYDALV